MTPKQLIESAIRGGWTPKTDIPDEWIAFRLASTTGPKEHIGVDIVSKAGKTADFFSIEQALLDPDFMRAVAKDQGWGTEKVMGYHGVLEYDTPRHYMHQLIDARCDGKSIEEAIKNL